MEKKFTGTTERFFMVFGEESGTGNDAPVDSFASDCVGHVGR
jgi:hypothetical protein